MLSLACGFMGGISVALYLIGSPVLPDPTPQLWTPALAQTTNAMPMAVSVPQHLQQARVGFPSTFTNTRSIEMVHASSQQALPWREIVDQTHVATNVSMASTLFVIGCVAMLGAYLVHLWVNMQKVQLNGQMMPKYDGQSKPPTPPQTHGSLGRRSALALAPVVMLAPGHIGVHAEPETLVAQGPDGKWSFTYPPDWEVSNKLVKTHFQELEVKSTTIKKCTVGIAVDPIKLDSLENFGDPDFVGERVVAVDRKREGVTEVTLNGAYNTPKDGQTYYLLDYQSKTERGDYHYLAKVAVDKGFLFVMTAKVREDVWVEGEPLVRQILESLKVPA